MAYDTDNKSAAELQREIDLQRSRVESTIDEIQAKLSPGQLVDELLAYTKGGGGEFVASLHRNITSNPLPVALLGVSLAWLMAKPATNDTSRTDKAWDDSINRNRGYNTDSDDDDYPVATISGNSLRRVGSKSEFGSSYFDFEEDTGKTYRAMSGSAGERAGHFVDEAGNRFRGFADVAGEKVDDFRDEAGNMLENATDWASHTWQSAGEKLQQARRAVGSSAGAGMDAANRTMHDARDQLGSLNQTVLSQFRDQPLIGGGLAFALGAALGGALPHTKQEDELIGEAADKLKGAAAGTASDLYDDVKEKAEHLYETATEKVSEVYDQAKQGAAGSLSP